MVVEADIHTDIHLRLLPKSELDISKVFESLTCCLRGIWVHPYTDTQAKLAQAFGLLGHLWSGNDAITSWLRLIIHLRLLPTSIKDIYNVFEVLICCLKGI
jgi:hypothetical protein